MPWDLENLNPPCRFFFGSDGIEWVDLRLASNADRRRIREESVKTRIEYKVNPETRRMERIEYVEVDEEALNRAANRFAITGWSLVDKKGDPIAFTPENVDRLMGGSREFAEFVANGLRQLAEDTEAGRDAEIKN